jgi:integrase
VKGPKIESGVRTIPIPTWLLDAMRETIDHRAARAGEPLLATDRLFTSPTGKPILDHSLWRVISRARIADELPRFRPYDLRHNHAATMHSSSKPVPQAPTRSNTPGLRGAW